MKANSRARTAGLLVVMGLTLGLAGCWADDDDDDVPSAAATEVPDSAGASSASFISFIQGLGTGDETSEPLPFSDSFVAPAVDEAEDPVPLT